MLKTLPVKLLIKPVYIGGAALCIAAVFSACFYAAINSRASVKTQICLPVASGVVSNNKTLALLGNSLLAESEWGFQSVNVEKCAVPGITLQEFRKRFAITPTRKPDYVMVVFGTVEVVRAARQGASVNTESFKRELNHFLTELNALWPKAQVYVHTVSPIDHLRYGLSAQVQDDILALNKAIPGIVSNHNAKVVNMREALNVEPRGALPHQWSYDGIHLNAAGYAQWKKVITPFLAH